MLVLTRRLGETLVIGDDIKITVLGISGNQVRVGVDAPKSVAVDRVEIRERKDAGPLTPHREEHVTASIMQKPQRTIIRSRLHSKDEAVQ